MGFGPALLGSFVSAASGYAPVYFISSFITLLALPIAFFALKNSLINYPFFISILNQI
ncbi:MAG: hypothetical protein PUB95_07605 [Methanobrevibacter ruminantium]|uniref:hypothetical protein n=1 Tax=Methanobrevibacter ruminantium TaxID=83816 RepID=UPI0026E9F2C7|nr:hypothetical protein [Methanobrevibacter ruminantium]MDD6049309.1 hypothetical protein [Methanobrevibacter ruminantium]